MVNDDDPPTVEGTVRTAENYMMTRAGELIQLEDLLRPGYSGCNQCALRPRGDPTTFRVNPETGTEEEVANPNFIPSSCPMYDAESHCVLEEGLVIETVQTFKDDGMVPMDNLTLFSLLNSLLNLHRLSRVGTIINYSNMHIDKEASDIVNKFISMTSSINNQYTKALKEMLATRKDQVSLKMQSTNAAAAIASNINKAIVLEDEERGRKYNGSTTPDP